MPALVLFRHGDSLTLAIINRRLHKRDAAKDVLEKVTLIRDIQFAQPHRGTSRFCLTFPSPRSTISTTSPTSSGSMRRGTRRSIPRRSTSGSTKNWPTGTFGPSIRSSFPSTAQGRRRPRLAQPHPAHHPRDLLLVPQGKGPAPRRAVRSPQGPQAAGRLQSAGEQLLQGHSPESLLCHAQPGDGQAGVPPRPPELHGPQPLSPPPPAARSRRTPGALRRHPLHERRPFRVPRQDPRHEGKARLHPHRRLFRPRR